MFSEIILQKKPPHVSLILLFWLHKEKLFVKMKNIYSSELWKINIWCGKVLTKMRNDLKWAETTWNNLQRPTTSKKQPETNWNNLQQTRNNLKLPTMTYNKQETTWNKPQQARNELQQARNNLKWPTLSKKQPETTYNNLIRPIGNTKWPGNNLQWARNDLKQSTMSKTQPTTTQTYLQWAKKRCQPTSNNQILRLFYSMGQLVLFSHTFSTQHLVARIIMMKIECRTFLYYHVYLLPDIKFTGYVANHFDTCKSMA